MSMPRLLTPAEVAPMLRCTVLHVTAMLREERLPGIRNGRRWLIPEDRLTKWIEDGGQALPGVWRKDPR